MADSSDSDLEKVSSTLFSSEYCHICKRIEKMNRGKVVNFNVLLFCVDSVNYPSKNTKSGYAWKPQQAEQAWFLLYFTLTRNFKYSNTLNKYLVLNLGQKLSKKSFEDNISSCKCKKEKTGGRSLKILPNQCKILLVVYIKRSRKILGRCSTLIQLISGWHTNNDYIKNNIIMKCSLF